MFALINVLPSNVADLSIGHLRCFVQAAAVNDNANVVTPSVAWLTDEHKAAIEGLAAGDHRRKAYALCQVIDMGSPTASGQFALDKLAALNAARASRKGA